MNVNGTAVIVLDEEENDVKKSNMEEREHRLKTDSMQKPLDTRLHHYVPVDDIDRKVLNGSDGTHITIPEDAVISFTTGRVRVKKSASNSPQSVGDRESIPLATMPPSYTEEKTGLGEKAELEAELANHKNGVWSEGHNYGSAEGPFSNSEKLNGTSKSSDEVSLPVNNHRKCLSREASDSSCSEQKSTGEKLYFTEDNRKLCPGWRRILICGLILIIIAVALLLGVLAATGILLAESENKNTRYESGQSLPSVDSLSLAGHSFRPRPPPKVPEKFLPPVTVDAQIPPNVTPKANDEVNDTVSQTPATVSSKVPAMNDTSHSQTIVPNALIGEFTIINENFTEDLRDNRSQGYMNLAGHLEAELRRIFKKSDAVFESLKILNFSPGSLKVKFLVIWQSDSGFILSNQASEILSSDLIEKNNSFGGFFVVDIGSIHFTDVFDECRIQKGGCSFFCVWNYNTLTKTCTCPDGMVLLPDKRSCTQRDLVIPVTSTERTSTLSSAAVTSTLANKMRTESEQSNLGITTLSSVQDVLTTEEISTTGKNDNLFIMTNFTDTHTETPLEYSTTEISTTSVETTYIKMFTTLEPLKTTNVNRETAHEGALNKFIPLTTQATTFPTVKDTGISEELTTPVFLTTENSETSKELTMSGTTVMTNTEILDQLGKEDENNKKDLFSTTAVEDSPKLAAEQTTAVTFPESTTSKKTPEVTTKEIATSAIERITSSVFEDEFGTTSIGFHITGPTTEVYTLKENTDYITDYSSRGHQTSSTTVNSQDSVPEQASTLPTNKYIINGNEDNFYVTTILSSDSTVTSTVSGNSDGTENLKQDHSTLNPLKDINYSGTSTEETVKPLSLAFTTPIPDIIDTEETGTPTSDVSEKFITAVSDVEEYSTLASFQNENITTVFSDVEESFTTAFSEPINNFTTVKSDAEENVVTTVPSFFSTAGSSGTDENITTIKSSTFVSSYSNKTPEVRSFDNFTSFSENFTLTSDAGYINTDFTLFNSSVELSTLSDNPSISSSTFLPSTEPPVTESSESETAFPKHTSPNIDTAVNATSGETSTSAFEEPNSSNTTLNFFTTENISTIAPQNTDTDITENEEVVYNTITVKSDDNMATNTPASSILDTTSTLSDVTKMHEEMNATSDIILETFTEVESNFPVTESSFSNSTTNQNRFNGSTNGTKDLEGNPKYLLTTNVFPETSTIPTSFTESIGETQSEMPEMSVFSENNVTTLSIPVAEATNTELSGETVTLDGAPEVTTVVSSESANSDNKQYSITTMITDRVISTTNSDSNSTIFEPQTKATTAFFEVTSKLDNSLLTTDNNAEYSTTSYMVTTNNPPNDKEFIQDMNMTTETETSEQANISTVNFNESYVTELPKNSEEISTLNYTSFENDTIVTTDESYFDSNLTDIKNTTDGDYLDALTVTPINLVFAEENSTFLDDSSNFTTEAYEDTLNGTTTDAAVGLVCREDQFLCGPLNVCINNTFLCDGIEDCPDGQDEFKCQDSCQSNFRCVNSSMCIMSEARCDGIWDCEDGTDEDDCTPTECAKHEVMCLDGSKCIKPGHICDWKYNCKDRSDEVGCVERTTCESGGKFFCNDGLCIPWSLKCDGEYDCKDGEDEGNCTCLSNEFQCNDGTCLQSSLRCDGRQDCRDADDEMGCVNVDTQNVVITFEPYHNKWAMLCGEDWTLDDGHYLCQELGFGHALKAEKIHVSFNGTWMGMRRENLTESSMWTERVSSIEICASSLAATVECQKFSCGEYPGLLHRRKREVLGSSSTQWPFIGYTSTFQSNKGCLSEILTPIWLITSAECLNSIRREPYNGSDWYVRTNIGKNVDADSAAEKHEVLRIISHPHSSKFRSLTIRDYDVALIRLKHALVFVGDKIGAICLPEEQVPPGITCFSGVLGTQRPRALPPPELTINSLALQIIDRNLCNGIDHYNNQINQRGLCTQSSEGHTICDNDEGTPLMCLTGINKWSLAGTLTYQRFCDVYSKHPAVFSNLFSMRKFVDQVIGQKQYETPYNSSMYVIIPPTTPSPIVPETTTALPSTTEMLETTTLETISTTLEMTGTTPETTTSISDSTPVITSKLSENLQDTTTEFTEEFRSEENITAAFEITGNYSTSADDVIYVTTTAVNTDLLEFGVENSTTRPMFSEDEILSNDSVTDKTHDSLMMSFLNETYADSEANATEISIFENGTSLYDNDTSSVLEEITSTSNPLTTHDELPVFTTESSNLTSVDSNEKTSSGIISTSDIEEAKTNTMTTETFTLPKESTNLTTSMVTATLNENLKIDSTTSSYKEEFVNPDSKATTLEMKTEPEHREKFEFELTGEPDTDMTFALFSDVDGIKLETEKASENLKLANISKEYVPRSRNLEEQPFINASDIFYEPIPTVGVPYDPNTTIFSSDRSFKEQPFINVSDIFEPIAATNISYNSDETLLPESRNHEKFHLTETTHLTESYNLTEQPYTDAYDTLHESITTTEISLNSETTYLTSSSYTEETPHTSNMDIMHDSTFTTYNLPNSEITHSTTSQNLEQPDISTSYVFYEPLSTTDIPYDSEATHLPRNESLELPHEKISDISDMPLFTTKIPSALETTQVMTTVQSTSVNISGQDTVDVTTTSLITTSIKTDTTTAVFDTTQDVNTTEPYSEDLTFITTAIPAVTSDIEKDIETASDSNTQIFKDHLISEKLQILEKKNFTAYDTEECGVWDQDSNVTVTSKQFFMKWPALGFLQMVSHPKMCASSILSPHFVITSLSCLSFRDNQLNPDKWAYIGGLYDESSSISGTQSHLVSKIIPYPNRNPPLLFNENDLALVQVKDEIKLDRFSKNVCLPYDKPQTGQECFISGWKKSSSDDDQGREFLSIPVSIISNEECNNTANYNGMLLESLICSMNNNESLQACQMDIGSPLFCLGENERWEIQGILNFPSPCDMTQPAVFNSIYSIREWAIEIVRNETTYTSFSED